MITAPRPQPLGEDHYFETKYSDSRVYYSQLEGGHYHYVGWYNDVLIPMLESAVFSSRRVRL